MGSHQIASMTCASDHRDRTKSGVWTALLSFLCLQTSANPRLLRLMMFILFDCVVIGELVLWNVYLAYFMFFGLQMNDFGKFYYSAAAWLNGGDMYGPSPATWHQLGGLQVRHLWNLNPPHFHIPLLFLALFKPGIAIAIWGLAGAACLILSWILIVRETGMSLKGPWRWRLAVAGTLLFAGTGATFVTGQLSFLLLFIVTLCWLEARRGRWHRAGLFLGVAIGLKLFMLILLPYFALRRQYRAILISLVIVAICFLAGLLVFGLDPHLRWMRVLEESNEWTWAAMNASVMGFLSRTFQQAPYFAPVMMAPQVIRPLWLLAVALVCGLTAVVIVRTSDASHTDLHFALLIVAALLVSPLGWIYYLWLPFGPVAAVVTSCRRDKASHSSKVRMIKLVGKNKLLLGSALAFCVPVTALDFFAPNPWITMLLGSIYFWGTLALWCGLLSDRQRNVQIQDGLRPTQGKVEAATQ